MCNPRTPFGVARQQEMIMTERLTKREQEYLTRLESGLKRVIDSGKSGTTRPELGQRMIGVQIMMYAFRPSDACISLSNDLFERYWALVYLPQDPAGPSEDLPACG